MPDPGFDDHDPWLDEPLTDEERARAEAAARGPLYFLSDTIEELLNQEPHHKESNGDQGPGEV